MERFVYAFSIGGGTINPTQYCGTNTTWNGTSCIGQNIGNVSCPSIGGNGGGGAGVIMPEINSSTVQIVQIDEHSVLVTFFSNIIGKAWVAYGKNSSYIYGSAPNFGYQNNSGGDDSDTTYHAITINNLESGQLYYFVPVIQAQGYSIRGSEYKFTPKFAVQTITKENICTPQILENVSEKLIIRETVKEVPQNCPGSSNQEFTYSIERIAQGAEPTVSNQDLIVFDLPAGTKDLIFSGKTISLGDIVIVIY